MLAGHVKVGDYGLVSRLDAVGAEAGRGLTPRYVAPEVLRGGVDPRSDQYSFCASLYEALYCQMPFPDESMSEYSRARRGGRITPPPASSEVPSWVTRTV